MTKENDPLKKTFIKLTTDFGFKRLFGSKKRSSILKRFLNALFEGEMVIKKVEFHDKELLPKDSAGKRVIYDIFCTTVTGHQFIVEMQQVESENFPSRILFYVCRAVVDQGVKGKEYELNPVYCIAITDFNLSSLSHGLLHDIILMDRYTKEIYTEDVRLLFLSLREVPREWDECDTSLKRMLYLIKNMENMTTDSKPYMEGDYEDMFDASRVSMLSEPEAVAYSQSYFKEIDHQSAIRFAEKRSWEEGREEGMAEGQYKETFRSSR